MQGNEPDFQTAILALSKAGVRFVVIGGLAMTAHGSDFVTQDLDLGYFRDSDNLAALHSALKPLHPRLRDFPPELPFQWDMQTLRNIANLTLDTDLLAIDLIGEIPGIDTMQSLWDNSIEIELYGIPVRVASLEDLRRMKLAANRLKDRLHLLEIESLERLILVRNSYPE